MNEDQQTTSAFLSDPQVRPLLNWKGIEKTAGLNAFRIKNLVGQDSPMSQEEHERLLETLAVLSLSSWAAGRKRTEQSA